MAAIIRADRAFPAAVAEVVGIHTLCKNYALCICISVAFFAPLLLFFAISGIWQMLGLHSDFLDHLSTIHTSRQMKDGSGLSSRLMVVFVFVMALSFIVTTLLGVVMAVKFGRNRRAAFYCLALGVIIPVVMVLFRVFGEHKSLIREF